MKALFVSLVVSAGLLLPAMSHAQAPAGTTGLCNDGTYSSGATKKGACKGHKGVKEWYAPEAGAKTPGNAAPSAAPTESAKPAAAPATAPAAATSPAKSTAKKTVTPTAAAPGGGPGQVWVNSETKVYHCQGTKWYGKTKHGEYMTEAAAKSAGNHADHGKACS
jgi:hypothetical protein